MIDFLFQPDTLAISILTISTIGFFIIFSIMAFLPLVLEMKFLWGEGVNIGIQTLDFRFRFLLYLGRESTTRKFLASSLLYRLSALVCLINLFFGSYGVLIINLGMVSFITVFVFFYILYIVIRSSILTPSEVRDFLEETRWLREEIE